MFRCFWNFLFASLLVLIIVTKTMCLNVKHLRSQTHWNLSTRNNSIIIVYMFWTIKRNVNHIVVKTIQSRTAAQYKLLWTSIESKLTMKIIHENLHFLLTLWSHLWTLSYDHNSEEENCFMHIVRNTKLKYLICVSDRRTPRGWQATRPHLCTAFQWVYEGRHWPDILKETAWSTKTSQQSSGVLKAQKPTGKKWRLDLIPGMPVACGRDGLQRSCHLSGLQGHDQASTNPLGSQSADAERTCFSWELKYHFYLSDKQYWEQVYFPFLC